METIINIEKKYSNDKEFLKKHFDSVIIIDCLHTITKKPIEAIFFVKEKVTYKGTTDNLIDKHLYIKIETQISQTQFEKQVANIFGFTQLLQRDYSEQMILDDLNSDVTDAELLSGTIGYNQKKINKTFKP